MNPRHRNILLALFSAAGLCAFLLLAIALYFLFPREPAYQGQSLSAWIAPFCVRTSKGFDAPGGPAHFEDLQPVRHAVSAMGTNSLPFLIEWVNHRESSLHWKLRQLSGRQPFSQMMLPDPAIQQIRAVRALAILGSAAVPAIPALVAQLTNPPVCEHAAYALEATGPEGLRALVNELTNYNSTVRLRVAIALMSYPPPRKVRGADDNSKTSDDVTPLLIGGLIRVAQDSTSAFRPAAIGRLGMFGAAASEAVPVLLPLVDDREMMVRLMAINALGQIHAQPDVAIPALTNHLADPDRLTQMAAFSALRAFGYIAPFPMPRGISTARGGPVFGPPPTNFFRPNPVRLPAPPKADESN